MKVNNSVPQKKLNVINRKRCFFLSLAVLLVIGIMLSGCSPSPSTSSAPPAPEGETQADLPAIIGLGTHAVGGTYYACGSGLAKVLNDHLPIQVTVMPTGGPNAYMPLLQSGEIELGLMGGNDLSWAYTGGTGYDEAATNLRSLATGHRVASIPLVVRVDSGITKVADLKGKKVGYGYGANLELQEIITSCLIAVGLSWDDLQAIPIPDGSTGYQALQEGRVEATWGATPVGAQGLEVDSQIPITALDFGDIPPEEAANAPAEVIAILHERLPASRLVSWEKQGILKNDATLLVYNAWLGASALLSADAAYEVVKCLYDYTEELHDQHVLLEEWERDKLFDPNPYAPYHEGAVRFWKEKGLWTEEAEANQQRLLALLK